MRLVPTSFSPESLASAPMAAQTWRRCGIVYSIVQSGAPIGSVLMATSGGVLFALGWLGSVLWGRETSSRWQTDRAQAQSELDGVLCSPTHVRWPAPCTNLDRVS